MDSARSQKLARAWDKQVRWYEPQMRFFDRHLFGDTREWVCSRATGDTLEVAIGTGMNLPLYPADVRLTGLDFSPEMMARARARADESGRPVTLVPGDATAMPFDDAAFDTVVCTFGLCSILDVDAALREMRRVLRPDGRLLLADHVEAAPAPVRGVQWLLERVTVPLSEEHFRRRPLLRLPAAGFTVDTVERFALGIVERLVAHPTV
ncbi:class I SAM-dependent methyltransferase [Nocardia stercoris]|nr:class I SAM-dependent methyltransferase [Nocardia stercoris]